MLCPLSYRTYTGIRASALSRLRRDSAPSAFAAVVEPPAGFEPALCRLEGGQSLQ